MLSACHCFLVHSNLLHLRVDILIALVMDRVRDRVRVRLWGEGWWELLLIELDPVHVRKPPACMYNSRLWTIYDCLRGGSFF